MPQLEWFPYAVRNSYPHMAATDAPIWSRFIVANPAAFDAVAYDVAVGEGASFDTVVNPLTGGHVGRLYQRRIDVVAKKDDKYFIIELKPRASTSAIGQVKGYAKIFARDFPAAPVVAPIIITDELLPEMEFLAKDEHVNILIA